MPKTITVYVCPKCGYWQRWSGNCDSLCEVKTVAKTYRLVK